MSDAGPRLIIVCGLPVREKRITPRRSKLVFSRYAFVLTNGWNLFQLMFITKKPEARLKRCSGSWPKNFLLWD